MGTKPASGRDLVAYFAGHVAHLVNGNDHLPESVAIAEIKPFQLYERVNRALTGNRSYVEGLVGAWAYPPPPDPEGAAEFYFDAVLQRPIGRRRDEPSSADRLRALIAARAAGPAPVPNGGEPSTWDALTKGPTRIRRFREKTELFELSNKILKCLDASNRGYAEVLRLGLCPRDWLTGDDAVSLNTLKAANAFLKALKSAMGGEFGRRPTAAELDAAWAVAPVPGFAAPARFGASPFGSAVLARLAGQDHVLIVAYEDDGRFDAAPEEDEEETLMDEEEASPILDRAVEEGAIAREERGLLAAILSGAPLAEAMRGDLGIRRRLKAEFGNDVGAYVADLSARVAAFVRHAAAASP